MIAAIRETSFRRTRVDVTPRDHHDLAVPAVIFTRSNVNPVLKSSLTLTTDLVSATSDRVRALISRRAPSVSAGLHVRCVRRGRGCLSYAQCTNSAQYIPQIQHVSVPWAGYLSRGPWQ